MSLITVISGHYGSGKSEISINLALLTDAHMIIDLDIVNPYFRSREVEEVLKEYHIELVSSPLEKALGSDLPYLSGRIYAPFHNREIKAIIDLGGDPVGAKVFRQFEDFDLSGIEHLMVVNIFREETEDVNKIIKMIHLIEGSSGLKITGLINNTNLLRHTTLDDLLNGQKIIKEVSEKMNLPIKYTVVHESLTYEADMLIGEIINLKLYLRKDWL